MVHMKYTLLLMLIFVLAGCGTSGPVTTNPDRSTTTEGTAGSAKMTDGSVKEGMTTTNTIVADSSKKGRDSLPPAQYR